MRAGRETKLLLTALAVFASSTLVLLLPAVGVAPHALGPNLGDPLLNVYFLEWGAHQISQGLPDPWSPPFFFPTERALTLSDHLLGPAVAYFGLREVGLSPATAYNTLLAATFWLAGGLAFWVLRRSGLSASGALVGGWVFAFSSYRWSAIGHYQVLRMQWIPVVLWTFDRLLDRATPGRAAAFLCFYVLHVSGGAYLAYLIHLPLAILLLNRWLARRGEFFSVANLRLWAPTAAAVSGILAIFYLPYVNTTVGSEARHPADELRRHGATLASFVTPASQALESHLLTFLPRDTGRGAFFPGVAAVGLFGVALVRRRHRPNSSPITPGTPGRARALALVGLALMITGLALADGFTLTGDDPLRLVPLPRPDDARGGYVAPLLLLFVGAGATLVGLRGAWGHGWFGVDRSDPWSRGLVLSGAVMLLLCLPVFFMVAWSVVPGMNAMRVPTRAFALAAFPLSFVVGVGWDRAAEFAAGRRAWVWLPAVVTLVLVVEALPRLPAWRPIPDESAFPAYTRWIAEHPEVEAYLELPLGREPYWEATPMYLQTLHWRPLANGYSATRPPSYWEVVRLCRPFPDSDGLERLSELGVTHIVVHWRFPHWRPGPLVRRRVLRFKPGFEQALSEHQAVRVFSGRSTEIYAIGRP